MHKGKKEEKQDIMMYCTYLLQLDVADGIVDVLVGGITGLDHVTVTELHGLGAGSAELTRDDELATLGTVVHDVPRWEKSQGREEQKIGKMRKGRDDVVCKQECRGLVQWVENENERRKKLEEI